MPEHYEQGVDHEHQCGCPICGLFEPKPPKRDPAETELIEAAAKLLCGFGLSSHTEGLPVAQAQALDLSDRLRALVADR